MTPRLVIPFRELRITDVPKVGGKNAALGELFSALVPKGISVPDGFAVTADAYRLFLKANHLDEIIANELKGLNTAKLSDLQRCGRRIRKMIRKARVPAELAAAVRASYATFEGEFGKHVDVAVRSSATAEDLPGASFAGQQETYLNIRGADNVLDAMRRCFASLFTDRAISYRVDKGFDKTAIALSVGIQVMVRSDMASSGVAFTVHTETGFENVVVITAAYGLGEMVVQGQVNPDEFIVFKPTLAAGKKAIIERKLGSKEVKLIYAKYGTKQVAVPAAERVQYALSDKEVHTLAKWCVQIEAYFSKRNGHYQPMDIEWAKDGKTGKLYIVQARPETIHATADARVRTEYVLKKAGRVIVTGIAVGSKIGAGKARVITSARGMSTFKPGEVLVTEITDPDWEPIMKIASGIVTNKGGRTSHAAIVSRELGIPCVVGTEVATKRIPAGKPVTVDCSSGEEGRVYAGKLPFVITEQKLDSIPETRTKIMVNVASPDDVFRFHTLPAKGVGLGRLEFIIA
ncbi:MAG: phosphoenolpyruvate synthase, partial [Patescibacteria group bacterium]